MGWSSRLFLVSADDVLHRLASTVFSRMLGPESHCRLPDFAGQRVRLANVVVELADGVPLGVRHLGFAMLEFDVDGVLNVRRLYEQQAAHVNLPLASALGPPAVDASIVDAASRFLARGGNWKPDLQLLRRVEAAALGTQPCPRVRVLG
jgi:hypothetical protein